MALAQKLADSKKSTFFAQFLWNLVNMTTSWVGLTAWLDKIFGFFTNRHFLGKCQYFLLSL